MENHFLQPVIYGRTVRLSPLVVLVSVLVGAKLAGVIGALGAIPSRERSSSSSSTSFASGRITMWRRDLLKAPQIQGFSIFTVCNSRF